MASIHIIGAGLSGLAAAVKLLEKNANRRICIYETTGQAGGRCRSYDDPFLNETIDNGNHLLIHANHYAREWIAQIGAEAEWVIPSDRYVFHDVRHQSQWQWASPFWLPALPAVAYLPLLKLLCYANSRRSVGEYFSKSQPIYQRFIQPLCVSAMNAQPHDASARLFRSLLWRMLLSGPKAGMPMIPKHNLHQALIAPALSFIAAQGGSIYYQQRLQSLTFNEDDHSVSHLHFSRQIIPVGADDWVIIAIPPSALMKLLPGIEVPIHHSAIINGHFKIDHGRQENSLLAITSGTAEWLFFRKDMISTTTSAANEMLGQSQEAIAAQLWGDIQQVLDIRTPLPMHRIITEKRATFIASPANERKRPQTKTAWKNLLLAGDYIQTGLPATIEGSIVSGQRAAAIISS